MCQKVLSYSGLNSAQLNENDVKNIQKLSLSVECTTWAQ